MQQIWVAASLLWFAGAGLRLTILAVPPVIALIQQDLGLTGTQVGILSGELQAFSEQLAGAFRPVQHHPGFCHHAIFCRAVRFQHVSAPGQRPS